MSENPVTVSVMVSVEPDELCCFKAQKFAAHVQ